MAAARRERRAEAAPRRAWAWTAIAADAGGLLSDKPAASPTDSATITADLQRTMPSRRVRFIEASLATTMSSA